MDPIRVVVGDVVAEEPAKVILAEYGHVIDEFAFAGPTHRSAVPFCQGLLNAVRFGVMPSVSIDLETWSEKVESLSKIK